MSSMYSSRNAITIRILACFKSTALTAFLALIVKGFLFILGPIEPYLLALIPAFRKNSFENAVGSRKRLMNLCWMLNTSF